VTSSVLVVDDDADIRAFLDVTLSLAGFEVLEAGDGVEALDVARRHTPDLILLDVMMPRMDGFEALRRLREDARTSHIPVVLLTALVQREDTLGGLEAGADDYVTKPFDGEVLIARIRSALRRADQQRSLNPLTGLPGNERILSELSVRLAQERPFALLYVDLDQFKPFNDHYGFLRGDEAIRAVADLLRDVARELGDADTFVGHVGGDDFVVILAPHEAETVAVEICARFDELSPTLYDPADRDAGSIEVPDRRGVPQRYPLVSVSIGIATTERREFVHQGEVVMVATEMKRYAKSHGVGRSTYALDRRTDDEAPVDLEVDLP
jgi:diguanylate cyclase (GGDEF)-like protein